MSTRRDLEFAQAALNDQALQAHKASSKRCGSRLRLTLL